MPNRRTDIAVRGVSIRHPPQNPAVYANGLQVRLASAQFNGTRDLGTDLDIAIVVVHDDLA